MATKECVSCQRQLNVELGQNDFIKLKPCDCFCCPMCAISMTANRKFTNAQCSGCKKGIDNILYFESSRRYRSRSKTLTLETHEPDINKDPCRYFMELFNSRKAEDLKDSMVLSLSFTHKEKKKDGDIFYGPKLITSVLDRDCGPETEEDHLNLRVIFTLLHYPIMKPHLENIKGDKYPRMTAAEFIEYCLEDDDSYLLQLLYALASGKAEFRPPSRSKKQDISNFLAVCVAKQMIERSNTHQPSPFQSMMADVLMMTNASRNYSDLLSKLRIAAGRRTGERKMIKDALIAATTPIEMSSLDAFCLHIDNFGFLGKKGKWSIHTVIQVSVISKDELKKLGFYNNGKISRIAKSMDELIATVTSSMDSDSDSEDDGDDDYRDDIIHTAVAKRIVEPKKEDIAELTKRVLTSIRTAKELILPSPDESRLYLNDDDFDSTWPHRIPYNLGYQIKTNTQPIDKKKNRKINNNDTIIDIHSDIHTEEYLSETFYEKNNIQFDNTLHGDPNSYQIVEKIVEYLEYSSGKDRIEYDEAESGGEEPVRFIISPATADGAPAKRYLDFLADDVQRNGEGIYENRSNKLARIFMSGFHFQMEFLTMRGRLSQDIFSFFGRKWRESDPSFNWITTIRDPTDALLELPQYLLCHYRAASEAAAFDYNIPLQDITEVQIHEYMLKRAVDIPMVMAVLFDLRLLEIALMIRDSEKTGTHGDISLFLSTLRLLLALFTITHATNYCHLVAEFLEWWELASDAERILFKNFYYTKVSPYGKPIWVDKGVEWTVRHIRGFLGHRVRPTNHDSIIERIVSEIPWRTRAKRDLRNILGTENAEEYSTGDWNDKTFVLGKAFHTTRVALKDTNFWGPGQLEGELQCEQEGTCIFYEPNSNNTDNEFMVSSSILDGFEIGTNRSIELFKEHHIINRYVKKRSEANVSLKLLPTNHAIRTKDLEITKAIRLSTDPDELLKLEKYFNKDQIIRALDWLRDDLYPDIPEYSRDGYKRVELVNALCENRKRYFEEFPEVLQRKIDEVDQLDVSDAFTTRTSREQQIKGRIYRLDEETKTNFV